MEMAVGTSFHTLVERARSLWDRDRRARTIAGFALLVAIFGPINLAMYFWTSGVSSLKPLFATLSTLKPLQVWLMANNLDTADSWLPMRAALDWVRTAPDDSLYHEIFFDKHLKFQYAPTSLLPLA